MAKYTLICEHEDSSKITHEFCHDYLPDILNSVKHFLSGVGFYIEGELDIIKEDGPDSSEPLSKIESPSAKLKWPYPTSTHPKWEKT